MLAAFFRSDIVSNNFLLVSCEEVTLSFPLLEVPRYQSRRRWWHPTPVLLPGKSHGWRSLEGCSPWGREESDVTERLPFHFSLSCIGEGNGNPLQCSCLENPRDGGAWWAAICGGSHRVGHDWSDLAAVAALYAAAKDTSPSLAVSLNHIISCFVTVKRLSWKSLPLCLGIHLWPNSFLISLLFFPVSWQTDSRTWTVSSKYYHVIL